MINQQTAILPVRTRISILERLAPSLSFALAALSGAVGAIYMQRFFRTLSAAENAGYVAYYMGMAEVDLLIGVVLGLSVVVGIAGIIVAAIRVFTANRTASPPGVLFLVPAGISLISPLMTGYAGAVANLAMGSASGIANAGDKIAVLNWAAIGVTAIALVVLAIFTFVPFRSKNGRKFSPVLFLIIIEGAVVAAAVAFFLEMQMCWALAEKHY